MTLADPAFPSSGTFDLISAALSNPSARASAIKAANGVFVFTLKNSSGATASWNIDLKESGAVAQGVPEKSDVTMSMADEDFQKLVDGKVQAQRMFMTGKLKVKGDVMKATKAEVVLKSARKPAAKL
ncbi:SCP2 sterol-binding domain-containing protein [Tricharina praecox]|uniref:SCP2 sterol-binding domain-containing protein n=1 Tax=Tricharina praecox TaxID=43433 RepID=UPI0022209B07|nr:SCP2 sterol-binding domain-containing protein [Tricharina praecox]KAI5858831.1 SCP2 sterol-binding domain-containing protein [Tricharina praecox]